MALVVGALLTTLLGTMWLGRKAGLGNPRSLLLGTGFAICGASAIAAMQQNADADEDDVAASIGMVTIFGTLAMVGVPLPQASLDLNERQLGIWQERASTRWDRSSPERGRRGRPPRRSRSP